MDRQHMISFASFVDELEKIAQDPLAKKLKVVGGAGGALAGGLVTRRVAESIQNPKARIAAILGGTLLGGLGGKEVGQMGHVLIRGAQATGRGLKHSVRT